MTVTDLLQGRDLDLALAELTDAPCAVCRRTYEDGHRLADEIGFPVHSYEAPHFTLDLIAAAEEPLVKAGWWLRSCIDQTSCRFDWYNLDSLLSVARATATDEVTARGNALLRGLLKLKEESK